MVDRRHSVRGVLAVALKLYGRYPILFTILALGVVAPFDCIVLAVTGFGPLAQHGPTKIEGIFVTMLELSLVTPLISALHAQAVLDIGEKRQPMLRRIVGNSFAVFPVVVCVELIANVGIAIGMLVFIVPGIVLWLRWSVVAQVAAVDRGGIASTLRRSGQLSFGHYWHIFGLLLVVGAVLAGVTRGVGAIPLGNSAGLISICVGIVVHTVSASFAALAGAVLYFDLRTRETIPSRRVAQEYSYVRDIE
jgi:hypothetical protein